MGGSSKACRRWIHFVPSILAATALMMQLMVDFNCRSVNVFMVPNASQKSGEYYFAGNFEFGLFYYSDFSLDMIQQPPCDTSKHVLCGSTSVAIETKGSCAAYPTTMPLDSDLKVAQIAALLSLTIGSAITIFLGVLCLLDYSNWVLDIPALIILIFVLPTAQGLTIWVRDSSVLCTDLETLVDLNEYGNPTLVCSEFLDTNIKISVMLLWGVAGCVVMHTLLTRISFPQYYGEDFTDDETEASDVSNIPDVEAEGKS